MTPTRTAQIQEAVDAMNEAFKEGFSPPGRNPKNKRAVEVAAERLGVSVRTVHSRLQDGEQIGIRPNLSLVKKAEPEPTEPDAADYIANVIESERRETELEDQIRTLRNQIKSMHREDITREVVRKKILEIKDLSPTPPKWLLPKKRVPGEHGIPTLFASDWHAGEVVFSSQVDGVNEFNLEIFHTRARRIVTEAIRLLKDHLANPEYPGIVFALGGDMISGDIHEELATTNDLAVMPTLLDLFGVLVWCIDTLADEFGFVFVPCVSGNHGRATKKIQAKNRNATSFEWLLYNLLEKHYEEDTRVSFLIPDGPDAIYNVYGTRHLLTHGDQFKGGGGIAGPIVPISRGLQKKQSRNVSTVGGFDLAIMGHWHQYITLPGMLINGSLKGYDEYAYSNNFAYQPPIQALWITHPVYGPTWQVPIYADEPCSKRAQADWEPISVPSV